MAVVPIYCQCFPFGRVREGAWRKPRAESRERAGDLRSAQSALFYPLLRSSWAAFVVDKYSGCLSARRATQGPMSDGVGTSDVSGERANFYPKKAITGGSG